MKLWQQLVNTLKPSVSATEASNTTPKPIHHAFGSSMPLLNQLEPYGDLIALLDKRQLIEIRALQEPHVRYSSMLLNLDFGHQLLWLDNIPGQPSALAPGQIINLRHHHNGYVLDVETTIVQITSDGIAAQLPSGAKYQLRRQVPRVRLRADSPLMIKLKPFYVPDWDGTVRDISCRGVRLALAGNRLHQLSSQQHIPWLEIPISDDFHIRCEGRVTGFQFVTKPYRHTCVSLVFEKIKPETQRQLNQFVIGLQPHSQGFAA